LEGWIKLLGDREIYKMPVEEREVHRFRVKNWHAAEPIDTSSLVSSTGRFAEQPIHAATEPVRVNRGCMVAPLTNQFK
jgi:hypothetical protein